MMPSRWFLLSICLLGAGIAAQAGVIDFETGGFVLGFGQTDTLEGFNFTTGGQPVSVLLVPLIAANCQPDCISDGTNTLGAINGANVLIDPIIPGTTFSLESFDVAGTIKTGGARNATSIQVIGNLLGGGQVTQIFLIDPDLFQTETLNSSFTNLVSMEFDGLLPFGLNSPEFQLDNIVYTSATTTTTPEPVSLILVASGLVAVVFAIRRKRPITGALAPSLH